MAKREMQKKAKTQSRNIHPFVVGDIPLDLQADDGIGQDKVEQIITLDKVSRMMLIAGFEGARLQKVKLSTLWEDFTADKRHTAIQWMQKQQRVEIDGSFYSKEWSDACIGSLQTLSGLLPFGSRKVRTACCATYSAQGCQRYIQSGCPPTRKTMACVVWGPGIQLNKVDVVYWEVPSRGDLAGNGSVEFCGQWSSGQCGNSSEQQWCEHIGREQGYKSFWGRILPDDCLSCISFEEANIPGHLPSGWFPWFDHQIGVREHESNVSHTWFDATWYMCRSTKHGSMESQLYNALVAPDVWCWSWCVLDIIVEGISMTRMHTSTLGGIV